MTPSDLTADLPAPRDDEPASLRDDIADELRDHLECALRREEMFAGGRSVEATPGDVRPHPGPLPGGEGEKVGGGAEPRRSRAYERVLQRFGNPRAVARKLWFDAMREKLMGQRISIVLQAIMAGAVIAMCVIVWRTMEQNAAAQVTLVSMLNQTQQELLQSQREANAQLVERLAALTISGGESPSEWNPLTVNCTFDSEGNPPAAGVKVVLDSESDNTAGIPTSSQTSGADRTIDFGKVLYGEYALHYTAPNGMQRTEKISVMPGQAKEVTVVCPSEDGLTTTTPKIVADPSSPPPAELASQLWYFVRLQRRNTQMSIWQRPASQQMIDWLIGPQGQVLDVTPLGPVLIGYYDDSGAEGRLPRSSLPPGPLNEFVSAELLISKAASPGPLPVPANDTQTVRLDLPAEPGTYYVSSVAACLLSPDTSEGMRLLLLTPPPRLEETSFGRWGGGFGQRSGNPENLPSFMVIYDKPATVDIPLTNVRFDYIDRVLKAAPGQVAWRFTGSSLPSFRLSWGNRSQFGAEPRARIGLVPEESSQVSLGGIEVIGWERIDSTLAGGFGRSPGTRRGSGPPRYDVAAVLLVTPEERELFEKYKAKLGIAIDSEATPRSQLTPEIVQALEAAPLPKEESTKSSTDPSATP